jgi:hypothetical protein
MAFDTRRRPNRIVCHGGIAIPDERQPASMRFQRRKAHTMDRLISEI